MSMQGHCNCRNIEIAWQTVDHSLVPRACQCAYCTEQSASWVSKSGSKFVATIHKPTQHRTVTHGSKSALFHECSHCRQVVFVTADLDGQLYGVLNADCLQNKQGFAVPVKADFSAQEVLQKKERWRQNWCCPVTIKFDQPEN